MAGAHRDVQHVGTNRRAVPAARSDPMIPSEQDFGPRCMILDSLELVHRLRRIADDTAVSRNERDAARTVLSETIRFGVEGDPVHCRRVSQQIRDEMRGCVVAFNRWACGFGRERSRPIPFVMADPVFFGDELLGLHCEMLAVHAARVFREEGADPV